MTAVMVVHESDIGRALAQHRGTPRCMCRHSISERGINSVLRLNPLPATSYLLAAAVAAAAATNKLPATSYQLQPPYPQLQQQ